MAKEDCFFSKGPLNQFKRYLKNEVVMQNTQLAQLKINLCKDEINASRQAIAERKLKQFQYDSMKGKIKPQELSVFQKVLQKIRRA